MELRFWRIDPNCRWLLRWFGRLFDEAVWIGVEGFVESFLSFGVDLVCQSVVDLVWRHEADSEMMVVAIVPVEETAAEGFGVLDGAEALRELGLIFAGFEEALREGIVVGGVRSAVGFCHAEVGEQEGGGLGDYGGLR